MPAATVEFTRCSTTRAGASTSNRRPGVVSGQGFTKLDYETRSGHVIMVQMTDQGGRSFDKAFLINVTDANDRPTGRGSCGIGAVQVASASMPENSATGTYGRHGNRHRPRTQALRSAIRCKIARAAVSP